MGIELGSKRFIQTVGKNFPADAILAKVKDLQLETIFSIFSKFLYPYKLIWLLWQFFVIIMETIGLQKLEWELRHLEL
jgi:hypothetical protein